MNQIEFVIKHNNKGIQILVDGEDLLHLIGAENFFSYLSQSTFHGSLTKNDDYNEFYSNLLDEDDKTIIFQCNCGNIECDCLFIDMEKTESLIIWKNFKSNSGVEYNLIKPLKFSRESFEKKLDELKVVK